MKWGHFIIDMKIAKRNVGPIGLILKRDINISENRHATLGTPIKGLHLGIICIDHNVNINTTNEINEGAWNCVLC